MVAGLLVGIWVARYLGPAQFGLFNYAMAFTALFGSLAKLGLDSIVVRELVNTPEMRDVYLGTAFWLKLMGSVIMLAAMAVGVQFTSNDATTNLYIFIIGCGTLFQSFEVVDFYFQSKVLSKFVSICKLTQLCISSLVKLYLIYIQAELIWFVLISLVDSVTLAASLFLVFKYHNLSNFYKFFDKIIAKNLLMKSWTLIISGVVISIYMRIDQVMINEMMGAKDVGIYSAAVRLTEIWYFIPVIITNSLLPAIIHSKKISEENYYHRLQQLYTLMIWMAISIALLTTFFGNWIILTLYGLEFKDAASVLIINIWTGVFVFFGSAWSKWMLVENKMKMASFFQINAMIFNVLLNLYLIPKFGIYGAAISSLIAAAIGHTILPLFIKSQRIALKMMLLSFIPVFLINSKK